MDLNVRSNVYSHVIWFLHLHVVWDIHVLLLMNWLIIFSFIKAPSEYNSILLLTLAIGLSKNQVILFSMIEYLILPSIRTEKCLLIILLLVLLL